VEKIERSSIDDIIDAYEKDVDVTLIRRNLRLSQEERVVRLMKLQQLAEEATRAGQRLRRAK